MSLLTPNEGGDADTGRRNRESRNSSLGTGSYTPGDTDDRDAAPAVSTVSSTDAVCCFDADLRRCAGVGPPPAAESTTSADPKGQARERRYAAQARRRRLLRHPHRHLCDRVPRADRCQERQHVRWTLYVELHTNPTAADTCTAGGPTEFTHMRYTAACCDPDDFTREVSDTSGVATRTGLRNDADKR